MASDEGKCGFWRHFWRQIAAMAGSNHATADGLRAGRTGAPCARMESLEPRLLLSDALSVTGLTPAGDDAHPFDSVLVAFNRPVQPATFTVDDIQLTGSGGPITPVDVIARSDQTFELDCTGLTGLETYSLVIGPDILDADGGAMDQGAHDAGLFAAGVTIADGETAYDGRSLVIHGGAAAIHGDHTFAGLGLFGAAAVSQSEATLDVADLTIDDGSTLTVAGGSTVNVSGLLAVMGSSTMLLAAKDTAGQVGGEWVGAGVTIQAGDLTVESGSMISADGQGYLGAQTGFAAGLGPGAGAAGNGAGGPGAGHGAVGGFSDNWRPGGAVYGSTTQPTDLGSGGSSDDGDDLGGDGGGAIRIAVAGQLANDGEITANGAGGTGAEGGGGSGGSIWVTTDVLSGAGVFEAQGGNGTNNGGGGAGGRIAVYYADAVAYIGFTGSTAIGGGGPHGGGGTGTSGFFDTFVANHHLRIFENFVVAVDVAAQYGAVTLADSARLTLGGGSVLTVDGELAVTEGSTILCQGKDTSAQVGGEWAGAGVTIDVGDLTVSSDSRITADGQGYRGAKTGFTSGTGPGAGGPGVGAGGPGAGHGGVGGVSNNGRLGGGVYGSTTQPLDLGSGGSSDDGDDLGGGGGGAIRIAVASTLSLDGRITANATGGASLEGGGGSGGSIWVTTDVLRGAGVFEARGGAGTSNGGGGGGGRIAVHYADGDAYTGFTASTATGGAGFQAGGTGTVGFFDTSVANSHLKVFENFVLAEDEAA